MRTFSASGIVVTPVTIAEPLWNNAQWKCRFLLQITRVRETNVPGNSSISFEMYFDDDNSWRNFFVDWLGSLGFHLHCIVHDFVRAKETVRGDS